jgi:hypothetical protein
MKILFSNPPHFEKAPDGSLLKWVGAGSRWPNTQPSRCKPDQWVDGHYIPAPMFMMYAASYCAKHTGAEVTLRDSIALHEGYTSYARFLQQLRPDLIFIEAASPDWGHHAGIIKRIADEWCPSAKIAVCGSIASPTGGKVAEILALPNVVAAISGEYEKGSVRVANGATGEIHFESMTKDEMNAAPYPMFTSDTAHRYFDACPISPTLPHAQVWSSRGCVYSCQFCSWPATMTNDDPTGTGKRTVRHYTKDYMLGFLSEIVGKHRFRSIYFDDDTFNLGNRHVSDMCEVMRKINLPWSAMCRADTVTRDTWKLMKESGCYGVKIGFESGVDRITNGVIGKHLDLKKARETVIFLRNLGMSVHTTWTFGHPGETIAEIQQTREFMKTIPHNTYQTSGTALMSGTPLDTENQKGNLDSSFSMESDGNKKAAAIREELARL